MDDGQSARRGWLTFLAGACALGFPLSAAAEEPESSAPAPKYLSLTELDAYLELRGEFTNVKVDSDIRGAARSQRSQRNREWQFEERLGLQLGGAVWDPSVLTFAGDFAFGLTQSRFQERTGTQDHTDTDQGNILQYDLRVDLLRGGLVSGSVYGLRQDDRINRRFLPTLDQRRTGFGTNWVLSSQRFPMELSYDYLDTDREGNVRQEDDEHLLESTLRYHADWIITPHQKVKFSYDHAESLQDYQGSRQSFETARDLFTIEHELDFGSSDQHTLRTLIDWQQESGDFARDFFRIGPQLTLKHSEELQTLYKYQANRELYQGFDVETHRADFQLTHQLYTNLTTTVDLFGLTEDADDSVSTDQYGAMVDWQYNRRNPFGQFYANLALAYDTQNLSSDEGIRIVLDEAHAFRDPIDVLLRNRDVILMSIVVTDAANRRVYRIGIDYLIRREGRSARLIRNPAGLIADRDTVLVDYAYRTPADGQLDTIRADLNLEQRFTGGLTPYYRLSYRNQEDDPSTGFPRNADRTDHHRLGVRYETKAYNWGGEFEVFDDTVEPYHAYHLNGLLRILQTADHSLNASTHFSQFYFQGGVDGRDVILVDVDLDHRWRLDDRWSTVGRIGYRYEEDSIDGVTHGVDARAGVEYVLGDFSTELTFDYDRLGLPQSEEEDFGVFVRIRREFPNAFGVR